MSQKMVQDRHENLTTTQRYMHLSPAALTSAIQLFDGPKPVSKFGDILETAEASAISD